MGRRGGRVGPRQSVSSTAASGIWTLASAQQERGAYNWTGVPYTIESLVIAGGGGGGDGYNGLGGGGAGGYRSSVVGESSGRGASAEPTFDAVKGVTYTITVGGGGGAGSQGSNSAISGSGLTTITSLGGGGGGHSSFGDNGYGNGGSGGGNSVSCCWTAQRTNRLGTAGQGYDGGTWYGQDKFWQGISERDEVGGGGGGAGSAGGAGFPGRGVKSSITGSTVGYAGGGGSRSHGYNPGEYWAYATNTTDENGTTVSVYTVYGSGNSQGNALANRGGGGRYANNGGSGVVIIRVLEGLPVATTTGAGVTVTTPGNGYRVYTFTASGSITF